jgi:hypothetical protein
VSKRRIQVSRNPTRFAVVAIHCHSPEDESGIVQKIRRGDTGEISDFPYAQDTQRLHAQRLTGSRSKTSAYRRALPRHAVYLLASESISWDCWCTENTDNPPETWISGTSGICELLRTCSIRPFSSVSFDIPTLRTHLRCRLEDGRRNVHKEFRSEHRMHGFSWTGTTQACFALRQPSHGRWSLDL